MKLIIFAGGAGTRLWPISRDSYPKQFDKFFDGKSTLQMAVDRIKEVWGMDNVYISTNKKFKDLVMEQIPELKEENLMLEPARRDQSAAILLSLKKLQKEGYEGNICILWADHLMDRPEFFRTALQTSEELLNENPNRFVYFAERPRFANHNLGWIHFGKEVEFKNGITVREFTGWKYRPELKECEKMFKTNDWYWNPGYFSTSMKFVLSLYDKFLPEMVKQMDEVFGAYGTDKFDSVLEEKYALMDALNFDNGILEKTKPDDALVMLNDFGWSDPGTLYALKEALSETVESNVTKGEVLNFGSEDCLVLNYEKDKLVTTIGMKGYVVVNMDDALLVVHKDNVSKAKELVGMLKEDDKLKKYS